MKYLSIVLEDAEYIKVKKIKKASGKNWHDFFLDLILDEKEVKENE